MTIFQEFMLQLLSPAHPALAIERGEVKIIDKERLLSHRVVDIVGIILAKGKIF
jgi:hypothetical protein